MIANAITTGLILTRFAAISLRVISGMLTVEVACCNVDRTIFSENRICDSLLHSAPETI